MKMLFTERNVREMALRRNDRASQYAVFDRTGSDTVRGPDLVAIVDVLRNGRMTVRDVGSRSPDVRVPCVTEVTNYVVASVLGVSPYGLVVQPIIWERLRWFYETETGAAFRQVRPA